MRTVVRVVLRVRPPTLPAPAAALAAPAAARKAPLAAAAAAAAVPATAAAAAPARSRQVAVKPRLAAGAVPAALTSPAAAPATFVIATIGQAAFPLRPQAADGNGKERVQTAVLSCWGRKRRCNLS